MTSRVTIGLAVYNGENFLAEAIESLLAQSFDDFELIISDNASSDGTESICRRYAAEDPRIHYVRQDRNRGAAWNQSEVMRLARGEFFKLAAHDDLCKPRFLERCVAALDAHPECVLAYTDTLLLPKADLSYRVHWQGLDQLDTSLASANERFRELIRGDQHGFRIFGVIRTAALRRTGLLGGYHAADHILLAELGLIGPFCHVPEKLFMSRIHPGQSINLSFTPHAYVAWWADTKPGSLVFPSWRYVREMCRSILRIPLPVDERLRCFRHVLAWMWRKRALLLAEIIRLRPQTPTWDRPR